MNENLDPTGERSPADPDPTTRMETPAAAVPSTPATPLTPASPEYRTPAAYEHEPAWATVAAASPVVSTAAPMRRSRARWAITIAIVALVIAASAAVALLITGRSSNATVLGYVPEGATMYGEVRLDLPGDQRLAVGAFLSKFPGFADQASLETKLNEVLDDLVKQATQQTQTYTTDIKPWFGGELAFAVGPLPPPASVSSGDTSAMSAVRMLALVSIKDPAAAQAWLDAAVAKSGSKTTSETYNGATLSVFEAVGGVQPAYALIDGKVAAIGDVASVKGAVDTKGAGAFSTEDGPKAALASSTGDHVGFMYVALRPLMDWSSALTKAPVDAARLHAADPRRLPAQGGAGLGRVRAPIPKQRDRARSERAAGRDAPWPDREPWSRRWSSTSPRTPSWPRSRTTTARRSSRRSTSIVRSRRSSPCSTRSTRHSGSSAGRTPRSAGSVTRPSSSRSRTGHLRVG